MRMVNENILSGDLYAICTAQLIEHLGDIQKLLSTHALFHWIFNQIHDPVHLLNCEMIFTEIKLVNWYKVSIDDDLLKSPKE